MYIHATAANQEEESPATNNWTKLEHDSPKNVKILSI